MKDNKNCTTCAHLSWNPHGAWECLLRKIIIGSTMKAKECCCNEWKQRDEEEE